MIKKLALGALGLLVVVLLGGGGFVVMKASAFDASMAKVYAVPLADFHAPDLSAAAAASTAAPPVAAAAGEAEPPADAAKAAALAQQVQVYQRGKHLAESLGGCTSCHGKDLASPDKIDMGPVGQIEPPNISMGGKLKDYSDAELHRLLTTGLKKDGRGVLFMPSGDVRWWPDEDLAALIGYLRTVAASDKPSGTNQAKLLGKVLDRLDMLPLDVARRLEATPRVVAHQPEATAAYGKNIAGLCQGCHGETLSGGPIPGAPSSLPVPKNITPHATGIAHYDYAKFERLMREGVKPDGSKLDPFMPVRDMKNLTDTEMQALWAYLQSVPPKEFGGR